MRAERPGGELAGDPMPKVISAADFKRMQELLAEHGVDALEAALRRRRGGHEPVSFRSAGEVIEAYHHKIITRAEARNVFGLRTPSTSTRRRPPTLGDAKC